ncbi:pentatricopeptide repeat-containing protein At1g08070, chloroplastic [Ricinus communis]|uniref:pentatricopeptide repeat-containing protein At1g08070, chloroplastic n=1 Tax=Ricinus communis TaxID=3988 RepID=UPI0007728B3D|nr:pentatricopeptide repeat-containing protein At1g08070, chloroplastic [Ricinus communis]XP_015583734.1 pentatricopeptide repeat-containing protein At1g08070, chloroplastic [Ricinus communis]XP_015583741.1 pentatricopeptide repeat-containing protein At1g08070, chloroplastic [Ricinus communis]XP_015583742.1 pentatricopeptide repeat-containing protein At1g08070, chloroplastic [Ricinus communis]XP_015583743.1 pentatricopeptide repeat-containing protein At1g08070, chloroplastic [Ricinus communis]|eukprot:XP_015583732.1 pentatricopeptide repeat-containing protein At1g08070, chloroplastic [Ricinus communis]
MRHAHKLFDQIPEPNVSNWNAMLKGYSLNDSHREVIVLFRKMISMDILPNCFSFPIVIKSSVKINAFKEGEELHCFVIKSGCRANPFVGTMLIDLYSSGRMIVSAYRVFGEMIERNVVAWTSMIKGFILCNDIETARRLFELAPQRDVVLWNIMISGYIDIGDLVRAQELFHKMPNKDVMSWNTLLNGYANGGDIEACERLFEEMPERNVFSWNGLIGGYAHHGCFLEVLSSFKRMLVDGIVVPNDATLVTVLSACARLGALDLGKWVHMYAQSNGYKGNVYIGNALIDMYAKCGNVENAIVVFKSLDKKDLISWNTLIGGLAVHGRAADALYLFSRMKDAGEKPDGITFLGVLCACTHMGLVDDGFSYFQSMVDDYSIVPQIEHYGCMVDLLARAGLLDQAVDFVAKMPMEADAVIWAALLGACRVYKNVELAELALKKLIEFEPKNPANYVMLSNIYGDLGRWKDVARFKVAMRDTGLKKLPGCSLIEVNDGVYEFYSLDERLPESKLIYGTLAGLTKLLRSSGYVPNFIELGQRS